MDIKTLLISLFIIDIFLGFFTLFIKITNKNFPGISKWMIANFAIGIGYLLIALRGEIPDFFSIIISQSLFVFGGIFRIIGVKEFFEEKISKLSKSIMYLSLFIFIAGMSYFTYVTDNIVTRTLIDCIFFGAYSIIIGNIILLSHRPKEFNIIKISGISYYVYALIFIFRILIWYIFPSNQGLFNPAIINGFQFMASMLIDIIWTTTFFVLYNEKLKNNLIEEEEKFRFFFENNNSALAVINQENQVILINKAFTTLTGYNNEDVIGKDWRRNIEESDLRKMIEYNHRRFKGDLSLPEEYEFSFFTKNNEKRYAIIRIGLLPDRTKIILSFSDITDRYMAEQELKKKNQEIEIQNIELIKAKEKAEESDKLKTAFLANMSHEIRTPMNGILGFADLLINSEIPAENQKKYLEIIDESGKRLLGIINDLIDISKIEAGLVEVDFKTVNINELIEYQYSFFKHEALKRNIDFNYEYGLAFSEAFFITDKEKLNAILMNLIKNALKFSNNKSVKFGYHLKNDFLEFFVKDTGIGIEKENLSKIFERFMQEKNNLQISYEGTGLGLSITKAYVQLLKGEIKVDSVKGMGSQFVFTIPVQQSKHNTHLNIKTNNSIDKLRKANLNILLVEDDEHSVLFYQEILKPLKINVLHTKSGLEALEIMQQNSDIQLILLDLKVPELSGIEACKEIRKFNKSVKIIAQTAYSYLGEKEEALNAGCNDFISKPIRVNELYQKMLKCIE